MVWGMIWLRSGNLYATITAHAVEVLVLYSVIKIVVS
jgi:membrane protease YdiL (CAAX protease family)